MLKYTRIIAAVGILLTASAAILATAVAMPIPASAHEDHGRFSAGAPGDPNKPARIVEVRMFEGGGKMGFEPARIEVRRGEQVRFVLRNDGEEDHEFILATVTENRKHAEVMKKHPEMEHDDPNGTARLFGSLSSAVNSNSPASSPATTKRACSARSS